MVNRQTSGPSSDRSRRLSAVDPEKFPTIEALSIDEAVAYIDEVVLRVWRTLLLWYLRGYLTVRQSTENLE